MDPMQASQNTPPEPAYGLPLRFVRAGDIDLALVDRGQGEPVVLLHAFPLDHALWTGQIEPLARTHRVLVPDLRGFGRSGFTPGTVTMTQMAQDVARMLDALNVRGPVSLAGISMGGYVALAFWAAMASRLRALILCDTRAGADSPQGAAGRLQTADRVEREGCAFLAEQMAPRLFAAQTGAERPELIDRARRTILAAWPQGVAAASRGMAQREDLSARLGQIACPVLVLVGQEDAFSPPAEMRAMAEAMPQARYVEIAGAGHLSPVERPEQVTGAIEAFLTGP